MANRYKGEVKLKLGGREYSLRPSFGALAEIEDRTGKSITELFGDLNRGRISIKALAAIVSAGAIAADPDAAPTFSEVGEAISRDGILSLLRQRDSDNRPPIARFMLHAIAGDEVPQPANPTEPAGEAGPAERKRNKVRPPEEAT